LYAAELQRSWESLKSDQTHQELNCQSQSQRKSCKQTFQTLEYRQHTLRLKEITKKNYSAGLWTVSSVCGWQFSHTGLNAFLPFVNHALYWPGTSIVTSLYSILSYSCPFLVANKTFFSPPPFFLLLLFLKKKHNHFFSSFCCYILTSTPCFSAKFLFMKHLSSIYCAPDAAMEVGDVTVVKVNKAPALWSFPCGVGEGHGHETTQYPIFYLVFI
jgi:hypothetical protein